MGRGGVEGREDRAIKCCMIWKYNTHTESERCSLIVHYTWPGFTKDSPCSFSGDMPSPLLLPSTARDRI